MDDHAHPHQAAPVLPDEEAATVSQAEYTFPDQRMLPFATLVTIDGRIVKLALAPNDQLVIDIAGRGVAIRFDRFQTAALRSAVCEMPEHDGFIFRRGLKSA